MYSAPSNLKSKVWKRFGFYKEGRKLDKMQAAFKLRRTAFKYSGICFIAKDLSAFVAIISCVLWLLVVLHTVNCHRLRVVCGLNLTTLHTVYWQLLHSAHCWVNPTSVLSSVVNIRLIINHRCVILCIDYSEETEDTDSQGHPVQRGPMQTDLRLAVCLRETLLMEVLHQIILWGGDAHGRALLDSWGCETEEFLW